MNTEYLYKGKNLTTLIFVKIEKASSLLAEREDISFETAHRSFLASRTYQNLVNPSTLLWGESAAFILDDYYRIG